MATSAIVWAAILVSATASEDESWFDTHLPSLVALYEHLHAHPELSLQEEQTSQRIAAELSAAGAAVAQGVGGFGVVGLLRNGKGPTVLIRADLDALPITEETGLPYASRVTAADADGDPVGVMHACGHDVHMTCLVGVARWLADHRDAWRGTVVLVGQPAEERVRGARAMLEDGLYRRFPKPDYAIALHVAHDLETGHLAYTPGPALASSTSIDLIVKGKGGHGAAPNETIDPIVLASLLVLDLQTIVSREIRPTEPVVLTVGSFEAGSKHNIIPSEAHLQLTLRTYSEEVRQQVLDALRRRATGLAAAHAAPEPVITIDDYTPPTINDPDLVDRVVRRFQSEFGADRIHRVEPVMGSEDFGLYSAEGVPIFMFRLGSIASERLAAARQGGPPLPPIHSSRYAPDAGPAIRTGVAAFSAAVRELLPP
ncbi:MAG: putative amidohydrolase [Isosphaeraceae bacterium]|jgi:hippurate hydrolase|nr:MAG: putative amidohydrolase [Isosphaeraceae bacterium]